MQLAIDKFGRMVLPKIIRQDLGLRAGDVLDAREEGDTVVLRPVREKDAVRLKNGVLVFTGKADGDLVKAVEDHRKQRLDHAGGRNPPS